LGVTAALNDFNFRDEGVYHPIDQFIPALWPEQWADELTAAQELTDDGETRWRLRPEDTALAFTREVMQWNQFSSLHRCSADPGAPCPIEGGARFAISRTPGDDPVLVTLDQLGRKGEGGVWSVVAVQGARVSLDIAPGDTLYVGDRPVARTTFPDGEHERLRGGTSYTIAGGCGSGGAGSVTVERGLAEFGLGLSRVECLSDGGFAGTSISSGERINTSAVGFVYLVFDRESDDIHAAMDASLPESIRNDFLLPGPFLDLAAIPVRFEPRPIPA
jgi:hypothetical protein